LTFVHRGSKFHGKNFDEFTGKVNFRTKRPKIAKKGTNSHFLKIFMFFKDINFGENDQKTPKFLPTKVSALKVIKKTMLGVFKYLMIAQVLFIFLQP